LFIRLKNVYKLPKRLARGAFANLSASSFYHTHTHTQRNITKKKLNFNYKDTEEKNL